MCREEADTGVPWGRRREEEKEMDEGDGSGVYDIRSCFSSFCCFASDDGVGGCV